MKEGKLVDHNAYYVSRRFYYETSLIFHNPDERPNSSEWCILQKISHLWLGVLLIIIDALAIHAGIKRYLSFKTYSTDPSKGLDWNLQMPLSIQAASLIISGSLLPVLLWTLFSKNGHPVNDGFSLGKQMIHTIQSQRTIFTQSNDELNMDHGTTEKKTKADSQKKPLTDKDYKRKKQCFWLRSNLKPVSITIQLVISLILIFPIPILHAEMIRNEVISPESIWHSDLDVLFGIYQRMHTSEDIRQLLEEAQISVVDYVEITHLSSALRNQRYEVRVADVSLEFFNLCISLSIFILKYSVPFWFTSRAFTAIISFYLLLFGFFVTTSISTISILYKVNQVGIIIPGRMRIDKFSVDDIVFTPIVCLFTELIGNFALIICLISIYDYGEGLFEKAHVNYLNLCTFSQIGKTKFSEVGQSNQTLDQNPYKLQGNEDLSDLTDGPCLISVTTKYWQPDLGQRRQRRLREQYLSDLKSVAGTIISNKLYLNNSDDLIKDSLLPPIRSCLFPLIFGFVSLFFFILARGILFHPYLSFYKRNNSMYALLHLISSMVFIVLVLILWFCLALKTSWRFRLIHAQQPQNDTTTCTPLSTLPSNVQHEKYHQTKNYEKPSEYDLYEENNINSPDGFNNIIENERIFANRTTNLNSYVLVKPTELHEPGSMLANSLRVNPIIDTSINSSSRQTKRIRPSPMNETVSSYDSSRVGRFNNALVDSLTDQNNINNPYASLGSLHNPRNMNSSENENYQHEDHFVTKLQINTNPHVNESPGSKKHSLFLPKPGKRMNINSDQHDFLDESLNYPIEPFSSFRQSPLNAYRHETQPQSNFNNIGSNEKDFSSMLILPVAKQKKVSQEQLCSQV